MGDRSLFSMLITYIFYVHIILNTTLLTRVVHSQLRDDLFDEPYRNFADVEDDRLSRERAIRGIFKLNPELNAGLFARQNIPVPSFAFSNYTNYDFDYDIWEDEQSKVDGALAQLRHLISDYSKAGQTVDQFDDTELEYQENVGLSFPVPAATLAKVKLNCRSVITLPKSRLTFDRNQSPLSRSKGHEPNALDIVTSSALYPGSAINKVLDTINKKKTAKLQTALANKTGAKVLSPPKGKDKTQTSEGTGFHGRPDKPMTAKVNKHVFKVREKPNNTPVKIDMPKVNSTKNGTKNETGVPKTKPKVPDVTQKIMNLLKTVAAYPTRPTILKHEHSNENSTAQTKSDQRDSSTEQGILPAVNSESVPLTNVRYNTNLADNPYEGFSNPETLNIIPRYQQNQYPSNYIPLGQNWLAKRSGIFIKRHCPLESPLDEESLTSRRIFQNYCHCGREENPLRAKLGLLMYSTSKSSLPCIKSTIPGGDKKQQTFTETLLMWNWNAVLKSLEYGVTGQQANVFFFLDGNIKTHLPVVKRLLYNLASIFSLEKTFFSTRTFTDQMEQHKSLRMFKKPADVVAAMESIKLASGTGRKIGENIMQAKKELYAIRQSQPNIKMLMFLLVNGPTDGCYTSLEKCGKMLRALDFKTYVIAFGSKPVVEQLLLLTTPYRIFKVAFHEHFTHGNDDMPPVLLRIKNRIEAWLGGPKRAQEKNVWFYRTWNWYKTVKEITYGSIDAANVAFIMDNTNEALVPFTRKLIYNYIRLFQLQSSYFTITCFGNKISRVLPWRSFSSPQEIQQAVLSMYRMEGPRLAAPAFQELFLSILERSRRKEGSTNLLFLITTGRIADIGEVKKVAGKLQAVGVRVFVIVIDGEAKKYHADFTQIATATENIFYGGKRLIISGQSFQRLTNQLATMFGKGSAFKDFTGNAFTQRLQHFWNWNHKVEGFSYGVVNRANVVILIDVYFPDNVEGLSHLVYNIMKLFTLSGTYFSLIAYESRVVQMSNFQQFANNADIMRICSLIPMARKPNHRTGNALAYAFKEFGSAPPGNPNVLITILTGKSYGDVVRPAAELRKYGVVAIAIGLGQEVDKRELTLISFSSAFMLHANVNALPKVIPPLQDCLIKVCGTWTPATGIGGKLVLNDVDIIRNWEWKAFNYGIRYHAIKAKPVAFVIDGTNNIHFDFVKKFAYNIAKLFNTGTSFLAVTYGNTVEPIASKPLTFEDDTALQLFFQSIWYSGDLSASKQVNARDALQRILTDWRNTDPKEMKVLFLIATARPTNDIGPVAQKLRRLNVRIFVITIGEVSDIGSQHVNHYIEVPKWKTLPVALSRLRTLLGKVVGRLMMVKEIGFQQVTPLDQVVNKPVLPPPTPLHVTSTAAKALFDIKMSWNWPAIFPGIQYGKLKGANVIVCLEGSKGDNLDVLAGFAFNFFRLFDPATTLTSLVTYSLTPRQILINMPLAKLRGVFLTMRHLLLRPGRKVNLGDTLNFLETDVLPRIPKKRRNIKTIILIISRTSASDFFHDAVERIKGAGHTMAMLGVEEASLGEITTVASVGQLGAYAFLSTLPAILLRFQYALTLIANGIPGTRQLSTITVGLGSKQVGQTVTTGSVPQENAGTPGPHDSGSPFSKPNLRPRNPKLPSAEIVLEGGKGGATGTGPAASGGTDVAAGGKIAGVTNAKSNNGKIDKEVAQPGPNLPTNPDREPSPVNAITRATFISPTSFGDKVLELGGVKLDDGRGLNSAGGIVTKDVERSGEAVGPITEISHNHVKGGAQYMSMSKTLIGQLEKRWNWPKFVTSYAYETVASAIVNVLFDTEDVSHFSILLGLAYNLMRLFVLRGTTYSVLTQGRAPVNVLAQDKTVTCPSEIRRLLLSIDHTPASFSIAASLGWVMRDIEMNSNRKKVLFLIIRKANIKKSTEVGEMIGQLRRNGVLVYIVAIGDHYNRLSLESLMEFTSGDLNFLHQASAEESPFLVTSLLYSLLKELGPGSPLGSFLSVQSGIEKLRNPGSIYNAKPGQGLILKIEITSRGCNGSDCSNSIGSIKVNGVERSPNKPGFNVVVIGFPSGEIESAKDFDTTRNELASVNLEASIFLLKGQRIILVATKGQYTEKMQMNARYAMLGIGAVKMLDKNPNGSFAMVAFKGLQKLGWTQQEQHKQGTSKIFAQILLKYEDHTNQGAIELPNTFPTTDNIDKVPEEVNMARGQATSQSSTAFGAFSRRAVDGNATTKFEKNSCSQTKEENDPWWRVDLEQHVFVYKVVISNQEGSGWERMKNVEIRVGEENDASSSRNRICREKVTFSRGETKTIYCSHPMKGRYVIIRIPGIDRILTLCEVRVFVKQCECYPMKKGSYKRESSLSLRRKQKRHCKCKEPASLEEMLLKNKNDSGISFDEEITTYIKMQGKKLESVYKKIETLNGKQDNKTVPAPDYAVHPLRRGGIPLTTDDVITCDPEI